jgi:HEAT repeat protein
MDLPNMPTHSYRSVLVAACAALAFAPIGCSSPVTLPDGDLLAIDKLEPSTLSGQAKPESTRAHDTPSAAADAATPGNPDEATPEDDLLDALAQPHWSHSVQSPGGEQPTYRWVYPILEDMLSEAEVRPHDLRVHLESSEPIVAANAAIVLLRTGDPGAADQLAEAARNKKLDIEVRCAAAETLGRVPTAILLLQGLIDEENHRRLLDEEARRSHAAYSPDFHAELIRALGRLVPPEEEPRLVSALSADNADVKLAALDAWQQASGGTFPEQGFALRNDSDPRIRAKLLAVLALHPSDDTLDRLTLALNDPDLRVRTAAIRALGTLNDKHAVNTLETLVADGVEGERIAAIRALAELGRTDVIIGAGRDKSWRVRLAVAKMLSDLPGDPDLQLAKELLEDASGEVQHQAIAAIRNWPPTIAEPLLVDALEKCSYRSQKLAAESLATIWPEGSALLEAFPFGQPASARDPALAKIRQAHADRRIVLQKRTNEPEIAFSHEQLVTVVASLRTLLSATADTREHSEALASLRHVGPNLIDVLEYLVDRRGVVLPDCVFGVLAAERSDFAIVEMLHRDDVQSRRGAARQLAEDFARLHHLSPLLLRRIADLAVAESDDVVWQHLLAALADQGDSQTFRLVYTAAGHPSSGVRQAACEHLRRHPQPQHADVLLATLNDASVPVACAALEALGRSGAKVDPAPILPLLISRSDSVQIAAAATLTRLGRSEGAAALERLAYSHNDQTRLRVAQVMGELALPEFAPTLVRMLDDRHGIRLAALNSLPALAECEPAETPGLRESDRVEAWRKWAAAGNTIRR